MFRRLVHTIPLVILLVVAGYAAPARADEGTPQIVPNVVGMLGDNGWYVSDVTVSWTIDGAPASNCASTSITRDTQGEDLVCAAGGSSTTATIKRDATPPSLLFERVEPNPVTLNDSAAATALMSDGASDLDTQRSGCEPVNTSSAGSHTVDCTAVDNAGNVTTATAQYSVKFNFDGFFTPVDKLPTLNIAKAGHVIPLKWRLTDVYGAEVSKLSSDQVKVALATQACNVTGALDVLEEYAGGSSGLLSLGNGVYQYNWAVPKSYANTCRLLKLSLGEGNGADGKPIVHSATFMFTR